ncbi:hypothetical protein AB990_09820 [Alkalihalobacillus pseudalcaliphilus]|nr:hypothetical protein AB990_09820 [Alkalihalobacillus pseudalcaliphilus]
MGSDIGVLYESSMGHAHFQDNFTFQSLFLDAYPDGLLLSLFCLWLLFVRRAGAFWNGPCGQYPKSSGLRLNVRILKTIYE